ncbi:hypothetical protein [Streptomyces hilarionis]|uniref:hypothetical protein n=1 Tax=Streptomyces hilarionis TaxID=2839954 RepID=UPI00211A6C6C|nr:hypothetical protein [Streptomyces hilarionis]MCQ9129716.1 hypothetical protein [Streptomyces hilarionis]
MSDHEQRDSGQERPRTALEELMREIEEAETHVDGPDCEDHQHRGEAADALTTNRRAQEESEGH